MRVVEVNVVNTISSFAAAFHSSSATCISRLSRRIRIFDTDRLASGSAKIGLIRSPSILHPQDPIISSCRTARLIRDHQLRRLKAGVPCKKPGQSSGRGKNPFKPGGNGRRKTARYVNAADIRAKRRCVPWHIKVVTSEDRVSQLRDSLVTGNSRPCSPLGSGGPDWPRLPVAYP